MHFLTKGEIEKVELLLREKYVSWSLDTIAPHLGIDRMDLEIWSLGQYLDNNADRLEELNLECGKLRDRISELEKK